MNNRQLEHLLGLIMTVVGFCILLANITVSSFGFYRFGTIDTAVVLLVLLTIFIIWGVYSHKKIMWIFALVCIVMIVISVLLGTKFYFRRMSALTVITIIGMIAFGIGLIITNFDERKE